MEFVVFNPRSSEFQRCHYYTFKNSVEIPYGHKPHVFTRNFNPNKSDEVVEVYIAIYGTQSKNSSKPDGLNIEVFCMTVNGVGHHYGATMRNPSTVEVEYMICLFNKVVAEVNLVDKLSYKNFKEIMRKNEIHFVCNDT